MKGRGQIASIAVLRENCDLRFLPIRIWKAWRGPISCGAGRINSVGGAGIGNAQPSHKTLNVQCCYCLYCFNLSRISAIYLDY